MTSFAYSNHPKYIGVTQQHAPEIIIPSKEADYYVTPVTTASEFAEADEVVKRRGSFKNAVWLVASLLIGVAWLGPITYILLVNLRGDTIGAAAWCPLGRGCNEISYQWGSNVTTATLSQKYDVDNHNLLGALQFVAKGLEVWYIYIATTLVWYVTVLLARRPGGLPVGYLLTHMEFGDLRALLDPLLYRSAGGHATRQTSLFHKLPLYIFVSFVILMCILANLIGPSVAVLVIPTLSWNNSPQMPEGQFLNYLAAEPPTGDNAIPGCTGVELQNGVYNCTLAFYASSLDAFIMTATQEDDQYFNTPSDPGYEQTYYTFNTAKSQEQAIPFAVNTTASKNYNVSSDIVWASSRQTLRDLSSDFEGLYSVVLGNTTNQTLLDHYGPYNSSFELVLQRYGPVIGMPFFLNSGNYWTTELGEYQYIRCYGGYAQNDSMAKCMRAGPKWNTTTAVGEFFLDINSDLNQTVQVLAFWSDKAVYIDGVPDPNGCFPNGTLSESAPNCDYDRLFADPATPLDVDDQSHDMFMVEFSLPNSTVPEWSLTMQFFPRYGFATYSIDVTQIWPTLSPAMVTNPPDPSQMQPIAIHPAWYLGAWGVNDGFGVPPYSDRGYYMQNAITDIFYDPKPGQFDALYRFKWYSVYAMAQAASLIPYTTGPLPADADNLPDLQPELWSGIYNQVWGWSISSRTSKLGVAVCAFGVLTVLLRTVLLLAIRVRENSSLEIITTAIQHSHQGEFFAAGDREVDRARVRYRLVHHDEELRLHHVRHTF